MAISVDLGPQLEAIVGELIENGRYGSKSEVLREGVRLVQEREARLSALNAALALGIADAEAKRTVSLEDAFDAFDMELELHLRPTAGFAEE